MDLAALRDQMTVAEKANIIMGVGVWSSRPIEHLGVPALTVTDGPNGARGGGLLGTGTPTACVPAGSVLGATWDRELVVALGSLLGEETRAKGANVLLAPTINLHRHSLGGRNFECYSEDPFLTGVIATAFVQGVQSQRVATTLKHFVANDSEFERNSIDVQVDERTLREVYLLPFEMAIRDGEAWGVMSAYNRLNGSFCSENVWLMKTVLRDQWGFDGLLVSDWFALRSTTESIKAQCSLEMPGPGRWYGDRRVLDAIEHNEMEEADLDPLVDDVLRVLHRTGAFDGLGGEPEKQLDRPEDRILMRKAAAGGTVMLRNNGVLPLDPASLASVAVIGANARDPKIMGGGSAQVRPYRMTSPFEEIKKRLPEADVRWALGCSISRSVESITPEDLVDAVTLEYFDGHDLDAKGAEALYTTITDSTAVTAFGVPAPGVSSKAFSVRATATLRPRVSGPHTLSLTQAGRCRLLLDGDVVIDGTNGDFLTGDTFFGFGSEELTADLDVAAGSEHTLTIEYDNRDAVLLAGFRLGLVSHTTVDHMPEALDLARSSDIAIVVVGTNNDWETEGRDRDLFDLPGDQPEMIRRVTEVNDNTIVVVNTGGPHGMDWLDSPAAVLHVGFGGQELSAALVDVLLGEADPGGRLPYTIPAKYAHSPALPNYPGENSTVRYGEGLFIGHRWFAQREIEPRAVFGEGMSYATCVWATPSAPAEATTSLPDGVVVQVEVTNTSARSGSDVVQVYIEPPSGSGLPRPIRELKGFAKVHPAAGETVTATIILAARSFSYFDTGDRAWHDLLDPGNPVPAGEGASHREQPGWYVEPGEYTIVVARSATDHVHRRTITLTGEEVRL